MTNSISAPAGMSEPARQADTEDDEGPHSRSVLTRIDWSWDLLAVSIVYLVEGVLDMGSLAVSYYAKDSLGLGPASAGLFQTAGQLPWELTPLLGLLIDLVPLGGYRRKSYLLAVGILGAACWGGLAALQPLGALPAGGLLVGAAAATAWSQVIADAVLVGMSQGRSQDVASFYQGLSWATYTAGALLSAYTTGRLLDAAGPRPVFGLAAAGLLLDGACAALLQEQRVGVQRVVGARVGSRGRGDGGGGGKAWWRRWWPWERRGEEQEEEAGYGKRMAGGAGGGGGRVRPGVDVRAPVSLVRAREAAAGADQGGTGEAEGEAEAEPLLLPLLGAEEASEEGLVGEAVKVLITPAGGGCGCGGAAGVLPLLRAVWVTLRDPHIAMPALFIFLWQSCPSPTSALFYFQVYVLHFSAAFQELVYLAGSFAGVMGVLLYQTALVRAPLKLMLLGCAAAGTALSATQLLLVTRANVRLGISDKVFVLGDYAVLSAIAEVMMTPLLALSARVCPPGVEATLYACLYSLLNLSGALSGALGALLTRLCGVPADPGGDDGSGGGGGGASLTLLVALCNACLLLPLPLLAWIPEVAPGAPPPAGLAGVPLRREQQEPAAAAAVVVAVAAGYELCSGGGGDGGDCGGDDEEAGAQGGARDGHRMALPGRQPEKAAAAAGHVQPVASTRPGRGCGLATPFAAAAQAAGAAAAAQPAAAGCSAADSPADAESPRRRPPLPPTASGALLPPPSPLAGAHSSLRRQPLLARHGSGAGGAAAGAGAQGARLSPAPSATVLRTHSLGPASGAALSPARAVAAAAAAAAAAAVGSAAPRWAGRATGQSALTCVGALAGAQVGVSPLVRMARSRSAALLAAADAAAAAAAAAAAVAETVAAEAEAESAAAAQADEEAEATEVCLAGGAVAQRAAT